MKQMNDFMRRLGVEKKIDSNLILKKRNRYFLLDKNLKKLISNDFFFAGTYLGKAKNGKFFPSFNLLRILAKGKSNKIIVDKKTEWLFICGRDIFKKGITKIVGSKGRNDHTLIMNQHGECLGFGKIMHSLNREKEGVVVKNLSDIGDFLRREGV